MDRVRLRNVLCDVEIVRSNRVHKSVLTATERLGRVMLMRGEPSTAVGGHRTLDRWGCPEKSP
jgi:hypothetical protein